jgi:hypothetical protein
MKSIDAAAARLCDSVVCEPPPLLLLLLGGGPLLLLLRAIAWGTSGSVRTGGIYSHSRLPHRKKQQVFVKVSFEFFFGSSRLHGRSRRLSGSAISFSDALSSRGRAR